MTDLTITGSGSTPSDPLFTPEAAPSTTPTSGPVDTTASAALLAEITGRTSGRFDLKTFAGLMIATTDELKKMQNEIAVNSATLFSGIHQNALENAQQLIALATKIGKIADDLEDLYDQEQEDVDDYNSAVNTYNNSIDTTNQDQHQINNMNTAINNYAVATTTYNTAVSTFNATKDSLDAQLADGDITQAQYDAQLNAAQNTLNNANIVYTNAQANYNAAVSAYNTYAAGRASAQATALANLSTAQNTYASQVTTVENPMIDDINVENAEAGIPDIPHNSPSTPSAPPIAPLPTPPPASPPPTIGTTLGPYTPPAGATGLPAPTPPPTVSDLNQQYFYPLSDSIMASQGTLDNIIAIYAAYQDYIRFNLLGGKIPITPATFIDPKSQVNSNSSTSVGAGAGVSLGLLSTSVTSPLATRNLATAINGTDYSDALRLSEPTIDGLKFLLADVLAQSGLAAGPGALQALFEKIGSVDLSSSQVGVALGAAFTSQIAGLVASGKLKESILALLKSSNPTADSAQLAKAADALSVQLNTYLLQTSVLATAQSLNYPELPALFNSLVENPAASAAVSSSSTTTLNDVFGDVISQAAVRNQLATSASISQIQAQAVLDDIGKQIAEGTIVDTAQVNAGIQAALIKQGVIERDAVSSASITADYLRSEVQGSLVLNASVQSDLLKNQTLVDQLTKDGITRDQINLLASQSFTNQRELRDAIAQQLIAGGQSSAIAYSSATAALVAAGPTRASLNPLTASGLRAEITAKAIAQGVSPEAASKIAANLLGYDQETVELGNPLSILSLQNAQKIEDKTAQSDEYIAANQALFRSFIKPNFDTFTRTQAFLDPGHAFLLSAQTSIQLSHQGYVPSNYKQELDFWV